ncbi:MAG: YbbR-like domain-containing protein [Lachnospiraceae bacterium]
MKKLILNHLDLKVVSLVIAILIWIVVANVDDYKTTKQITGIEIEFVNGNAITERNKVYEVPEGTTIDIVIKGPRSTVEGLTRDDFKAVADLSKMSITNAVLVDVSAVSSRVDKEISIAYSNNAVNVEVEDKVEKQLPITVKIKSSVAEGYAISNKSATPNLITVKGAESIVNTISEVYVEVDVSKANRDIVAYGEPVFLDYAGEVIDATRFEYDVTTAEVTVQVKKTKELAVKVKTQGEVKSGYAISSIDYQPTSVVVVGEPEDLARVDEIVIGDIKVSGCDQDLETSVNIADYLPSGIVIADETEEIMIKVIIEEIKEKTIKINNSDINIVGKNNDYTYSFVNKDGVSITAKGLKNVLDDLKITNLIPSIDVTNYKPGIYEFKLNLRDVNGVTIEDIYVVELEIKSKS